MGKYLLFRIFDGRFNFVSVQSNTNFDGKMYILPKRLSLSNGL